jgi:hypothetical protein
MTYIMVDGWTSCAAEVCRIWSLVWYHLANYLFVRTEKERVKITPATPADLNVILPRVLLYFLIGLVYSIISPLILPFLCVYFSFGYVVYRHQVCASYNSIIRVTELVWMVFLLPTSCCIQIHESSGEHRTCYVPRMCFSFVKLAAP